MLEKMATDGATWISRYPGYDSVARTRPSMPRFPFVCCLVLLSACSGRLGYRQDQVVEGSVPVPAQVRRLAIEVDFGSITVLAAADGATAVSFEGESLRAADDAQLLAKLATIDLTLQPSLEDDLLTLRAPSLPAGVDPAAARMVVRAVVHCPAHIEVTVTTGLGSLKASGFTSGVDLTTAVGHVVVSGCTGPARVSTTQGDVLVDTHRGNLVLEASAGSVRAFVTELGPMGVKSTARDVLEVHLPRQTGFDLRARTDRGRCHNSFGLTIVIEGQGASMTGSANGGGPELDLRSEGGPVTVGASN